MPVSTASAGQGPAIPTGAWPAALLTCVALLASLPWVAVLVTLVWDHEAALVVPLIPFAVGIVLQWSCARAFRPLYREYGTTWRGRRQVGFFMFSRAVLTESARAVGLPAPAAIGTAAAVGRFACPVVGMLLYAWLGGLARG